MFAKLFIANDHGGFAAKNQLVRHLENLVIPVEDMGCDSADIVRYPYYAARVAQSVLASPGSGGILICSTGIGMSIIANKFKGIRAALCTSGYMAKMTRLHNDSNVLCLGGKITGEFDLYDIVDNWLSHEFEGGRHEISLGLIRGAEREMITGEDCTLARARREDEA